LGNLYFASDFHLGIPSAAESLEREKRIVRWLESIAPTAERIYLVGDLFDFWFEYKDVVPRGFTRLLGTLARLQDSGIEIEVFTGNHDLWMFGYLESELGVKVHHHPIRFEASGKHFLVGHGDGIGPGDHGYKWMKKVFTNRLAQRLFGALHPRIAFGMARYWSGKSRMSNEEEAFLGEDKEWQVLYAKDILKNEHIDYFLFGHRHILLELPLGSSTLYNLGDWVTYNSYVEFDGQQCMLKKFEG
jgi:UDP-2,3-diacylglucosamine hydrolase